MINAAMIPGTKPANVKIDTISIDPHPRSNTDKGGSIIARITLNTDILFNFLYSLILYRYNNIH